MTLATCQRLLEATESEVWHCGQPMELRIERPVLRRYEAQIVLVCRHNHVAWTAGVVPEEVVHG